MCTRQFFGNSVFKGLCCALVTLSFVCLRLKCGLSLSQVVGARTVDADHLIRLNYLGKTLDPTLEAAFPAERRVEMSIKDVLGPWQAGFHGWRTQVCGVMSCVLM